MNNLETYIILFLLAVSALSAGAIVFLQSLFHAALALLVCLLALAGLYGLWQAEFIAITQVLIYAGGIVVLIIFAIMLTHRIGGTPLLTETHHRLAGLVISAGIFVILAAGFSKAELKSTAVSPVVSNPIRQIGVELMTTYVAPFEIGGILLLVCLVGASLAASSYKNKPDA
jgi:NADH:ubiquinone oxidoreductase subunit 6 (subunit J)